MSTDGLIESRDDDGNHFGVSKLVKSMQQENFIDSPMSFIKNELINFNQQKFDDDVSLISISASK
jgi:serine phosphatase RsbU (regulator of sigma subunit)